VGLLPASGQLPPIVAITDKIYLKNHRQLASQLETSFPKSAFSGATLDLLFRGENLANLDEVTQEKVLDFATDFMDCNCQSNPHCGHPQEKFIRYLLELRGQGLGPDAIVNVMGQDYMLYAYAGDVLSFLDDAVRTLEAAEELASVDRHEDVADEARESKKRLT
jgi:superfamily II helicase